jgi:hypothetical protein
VTAHTPVAGPAGPPAARQRIRSHSAPLAVAFAALLFVFPSSVVLAGPLKSNGHPLRILGLMTLVVLALDLLRARREDRIALHPTVVLLLLYLAQALFFYGWAADDPTADAEDAAGDLRSLLFTVSACGIALYTATRVTTLRTATGIVAVVVGGCTLNAAVAISQAIGAPFVWARIIALPGLSFVGSVRGVGERAGLVRVVGTAAHPIEFAVVLGCCLPFAVHLALHARTSRGRQFALGGAGLMTLATPFALSRGGLICIAVSVLVFLLAQSWSTRGAALLAGVVAACVSYVLVPSTYRAVVELFTATSDDASIRGRTDDLPLVDAAFEAAPWLGGSPLPPDLILDNQWFGTLVSSGLVGLGALALLFVLPVIDLLATAWRVRRTDRERQSLAAALAGCMLALAVSGAVFDLFAFGTAAMLLFFVIGLSAGVVRGSRTQPA